jgi:hypothetical protein
LRRESESLRRSGKKTLRKIAAQGDCAERKYLMAKGIPRPATGGAALQRECEERLDGERDSKKRAAE